MSSVPPGFFLDAQTTPSAVTGHRNVRMRRSTIYGTSAIFARWWGNRGIACFGWHPKGNPEVFRFRIDVELKPRPRGNVNALFQGDAFCCGDTLES